MIFQDINWNCKDRQHWVVTSFLVASMSVTVIIVPSNDFVTKNSVYDLAACKPEIVTEVTLFLLVATLFCKRIEVTDDGLELLAANTPA